MGGGGWFKDVCICLCLWLPSWLVAACVGDAIVNGLPCTGGLLPSVDHTRLTSDYILICSENIYWAQKTGILGNVL